MILNVQLLLLLTLTVRTDGYDMYRVGECIWSSSDLTDVESIDTFYFNMGLWVQFNSTVGKFVGFTEYGVRIAENWNSLHLEQERAGLERYCKGNIPILTSTILDKTVEPKIRLRSEKQFSGGHTAMLMCSAYDFYPAAIDVYWLRDGKKVTSEVISTEELADGDWYYQVHSHLEYTPRSGEKISCVVEHASFSKPMTYNWDPSLPESERSKVIIGASGLVLGIILSAAGFIYYKKKSSGVL
ncbi:H-2 class II histocompatibility antigen, E-S beta chain-like isoform X1 [Hoplias malabaricus]|uniref:H-2 class II histocompatibility antigen, E-S beta chain-like isoform X1 n=1 Tax=Hoplias malabaricus TaxID=27720 RepID=UPI003462D4A4